MKGMTQMKRFWIFAIASALLLSGCASNDVKTESGAAAGGFDTNDTNIESNAAITEIALESEAPTEPQIQKEPPQLQLEVNYGEYVSCMILTKGSYTWSYDNGDGTAADVKACCDVPGNFKNISASFAADGLAKAPKALLKNGSTIVRVECWNGDESMDVKFTKDGEIILPDEPIGDIYSITVKYENGTCDYIFKTESRSEPKDVSGGTASVTPAEPHSSAEYNPDTKPVEHIGNTSSYPPQTTPEPPQLVLGYYTENNDDMTELPLVQCGFMWTYKDENGNLTTLCADCPAPYQLKLEPAFNINEAVSASITLPENAKITSVLVWNEDGDCVDVEFDPIGTIAFPENALGDIYSVNVSFPEGECVYVFSAYADEYFELAPLPSTPTYNADELYKPKAEINRFDGFYDGSIYPLQVIHSLDELKLYYMAHMPGIDLDIGYDEEFFKDNILVLTAFEEGSGSIRHEFMGITEDGQIIVKRTTPEVGTDDMAAYELSIEIPRGKALDSYTMIFDNIYQ